MANYTYIVQDQKGTVGKLISDIPIRKEEVIFIEGEMKIVISVKYTTQKIKLDDEHKFVTEAIYLIVA